MIRHSLGRDGRINVLLAQNSAGAIEKMNMGPDLVLVDIDLGRDEPNGIEFVPRLRALGFDGLIYMIAGDGDPALFHEAMRASANGYLVKGAPMESGFKAEIDRLLFHDEVSSSDINFPDRAYPHTNGLKNKQIDLITRYYRAGFPDLEDFAALEGISLKTLSKRLIRIEKKLGVTNKAQLAALLTVLAAQPARGWTVKDTGEGK